MKTRRNLRRTLRGGDPAVIGIVLGSVLAVGIGAMMYRHMRTRKHHNSKYWYDSKPRKNSSDEEEYYDAE